ncbi:MAG TPA: hypothetical protein VGG74_12765 [Kofleriaceae bacterium]
MAKTHEDPRVAAAFSKDGKIDLESAIAELDPEAAQHFLKKLEAAFRKRKIMLSGYLVAIVSWVVGMVFALAYFGVAHGFVAWVFMVPFGIVGAILYGFGAWANRVGRSADKPPAGDTKRL